MQLFSIFHSFLTLYFLQLLFCGSYSKLNLKYALLRQKQAHKSQNDTIGMHLKESCSSITLFRNFLLSISTENQT